MSEHDTEAEATHGCGLSPKQMELLDTLAGLDESAGLLGLAATFIPGFPTTGQGIAEYIIGAEKYAEYYAHYEKVMKFYNDPVGGILEYADQAIEYEEGEEGSFSQDLRGFVNKVKPIASTAINAVLTTEQIANEVSNFKNKWSGVDIDYDNVVSLIKDGAITAKNLCHMVDDYGKAADGSLVLRGKPIVIEPGKWGIDLPGGRQQPIVIQPEFVIDLEAQEEEALIEYEGISDSRLRFNI